jgi:hypothetical protein
MTQLAAALAPDNVFEIAAAPVAPSYVFIEAFGTYVTADGKTFATEADVQDYLNKGSIDASVDEFLAYVDANQGEFFTVPAHKERTKRDGTVIPATGARLMDAKAIQSARTRLEKAARVIYGLQYRQ